MTRKITFILLLAISSQLVAETVYIRDILDVPLGGCQSQDHRIQHRGLRNGLMLERLETNRLTGYSRVRTEGWLESKYHLTEPMAVARLYAVISK